MDAGDTELTIELGEVANYRCPCCDNDSETVHGFLYDKSGATSVYFAGYTHGHPERSANMVLSVGDWGEGTAPSDRSAIAVQVDRIDGDLVFSFPPAETSPWYGEEFLGRMLSPEELTDQDRVQYRNLASIAVRRDPRVSSYFEDGQ